MTLPLRGLELLIPLLIDAIRIGFLGRYGTIMVESGAVAQSGVTSAATKLLNWETDGVAAGVIPDQANNQITLLNKGVYLSLFQISFSGSPNAEFEFQLRVNGIDSGFHCRRKLGAGGDIGSASLLAINNNPAGAVCSIYVLSTTGGPGASLTMNDATLGVIGIAN